MYTIWDTRHKTIMKNIVAITKIPQLKNDNSIFNNKISAVIKEGACEYQHIPEAVPL